MLKHIKIRTKLLVAFGLVSLITVVISVISIYYVNVMSELSFEVGKKLAPLSDAVMEIKLSATRAHLYFEELMSGDEEGNSLSEIQGLIDESIWYCDAILAGGKSDKAEYFAAEDSAVVSLITQAKSNLVLFKQAADDRYRLYKSNANAAAAGSAADIQFDAAFEEFVRLAEEAGLVIRANMAKGMLAREAGRKSSIAIVGIAGIVCAILSMVIAVLVANSIARPIKYLAGVILKISEGDLTQTINAKNSKDEVGLSLMALDKMTGSLKQVVTNIVRSTDIINTASSEMNTSSQQLSEGASEQASAVEEISSSMEEMVANIQQNSENAKQTEKIAETASKEIISGSEAVDQTVGSMKVIATKISIIGEIARQTNILALNAAVEAARAGEHGRGFAVVAAEVRKLAERSQAAANEINAVSFSSVEVAQKSGELLKRIVPNIQRTADLVQEIASSSAEQNSGSDQINNAIQQLNQAVQQAAATAEELAASSQELNAQAESMRQLVGFFKLTEAAPKAAAAETSKKQTEPTPKNTVARDRKAAKPVATAPQKTSGIKLRLNGTGADAMDSEFTRF